MNKFVKYKLKQLIIFSSLIICGISIILYLLEDKITFYYTPSQLKTEQPPHKQIRLGGFVATDSIEHIAINKIKFKVTDFHHAITVQYQGAVPQLFRDTQGVIIKGYLDVNNEFIANQLLTKHDEKYTPPTQDKIKG